jgi:hypothetical protein
MLDGLAISDRRTVMRVFLSAAAVLIAVLGCAWLFFPEAMLGRWGVHTDPVGLFMGRRYGTMLLGYAVILGLSRAAGPSAARTAILVGGAIVTGSITLVSLGGILSETIGPGAWITVVVEALLAGGFLYFLVVARAARQGDARS